jgi:hypothetical protein
LPLVAAGRVAGSSEPLSQTARNSGIRIGEVMQVQIRGLLHEYPQDKGTASSGMKWLVAVFHRLGTGFGGVRYKFDPPALLEPCHDRIRKPVSRFGTTPAVVDSKDDLVAGHA